MDNFYTLTVYEKGAEVIRLYEAVLGKEGFRKGMDLYFQRHDGQAVTCDDFLAAMADANGEGAPCASLFNFFWVCFLLKSIPNERALFSHPDLSSLARWYSQAGTPTLDVHSTHDAAAGTLTLRFVQATPATPGQPVKQPVLIPVRVALLGADGAMLPLHVRAVGEDGHAAAAQSLGTETVLRVTRAEQSFVFEGVGAAKPVPSLLRNFSAPVKMTVHGQTDGDLAFLLAHDTDAFNRYEAGQVVAKKLLLSLYAHAVATGGLNGGAAESLEARLEAAGGIGHSLIDAYRALLADATLDGAFKAFAVSLPADTELLAALPACDPLLLHAVRTYAIERIARALQPEFAAAVAANSDAADVPYEFSAAACARRALKNKALGYLATLGDARVTADLEARAATAANMTDEFAALMALDMAAAASAATARETAAHAAAMAAFARKWAANPLVMLKWITAVSVSNVPGNVKTVQALVDDASKFTITNPNNCYSLFLAFARSAVNFHAEDGSGYAFMGDACLRVDGINHQVASRLVSVFTTWRQFDAVRGQKMRAQLERIVATPGLSENVFEIASKSLN